MAVDPNLPNDQKKRLHRADLPMYSGTGMAPVLYRRAPAPSPPEEEYRPTERPRDLAAEAENARAAFIAAEERAIAARQRALHDRGARRLFRGVDAQGNTVYTDTPGDPLMVGPGEERFYGADGWRIDEGLTNPGRAADIQPGRGRARGLRRAQTAFYDELDARNDRQLESIGRRRQQVEEQMARNQQFALAQQIEGMQRLGYSPDAIARATGQGQGMDIGDMIRLMQLQETRNQNRINNARLAAAEERQMQAEQRQQLDDLVKRFREDPDATLREELAFIAPLQNNPDALDDYFLNNPRGQILERMLNERMQSNYRGGLFSDMPRSLGDLQPRSFMGRLTSPLDPGPPNPFRRSYGTPGDMGIGGWFSSYGLYEDELGLGPGDMWLLDYFADRAARLGR